jgi:ubiquinone/menaquinone biosynthesis C-methylase UbiE
MELTDPAKLKAQKTYNAAADLFDARPLGFWARYGARTVARLHLKGGATVLDVACGTGASALPAAAAVGQSGRVVGVDLAENLLTLAREKAKRQGLTNAEFRHADMTSLGYPDGTFDAVICVFGIFFVKDMEALTAELWRMVNAGGQLAITTWGPRVLAPMSEKWNETVRGVRSDLVTEFSPWDRITTPDAVRRLFTDAGVPDVEVTPEAGSQPLEGPDDVWTIAAGSGYRWVIEQLGPEAERVRQEMVAWARKTRLSAIETNVIYGVATRR